MAKQKENKQLTRRQQSHAQKEARVERTITIVAIAVVAVIAVLAIVGIVTDTVQARRAVARVDEDTINTKDFQTRLYYERWTLRMQALSYEENINRLQAEVNALAASPQEEGEEAVDTSIYDSYIQQMQAYAAQLNNQLSYDYANILGGQVLEMMMEERLILTEAESRGLSVTEDEIERGVEAQMGYDRDAAALAASEITTETVGTVMTAEEYEEIYNNFQTQILKVSEFTVDDFRALVEADLLREKLIEDLSGTLDTTADQVQTIAFSAETEEAGLALQERLNSGEEEVSAIMEDVNASLEDGITGYEMPYLPVTYLDSQFNQEIAQRTFNANVGSATEPVLGPGDTYFVMYVVAHEERELSEDIFGSTADQAYDEWLTENLNSRTEYLEWEQAVLTEP